MWWAERAVWVTSRFRDGNVPAQSGVLEIVQVSVARLRALGVNAIAVRSDSAGYQHAVLDRRRAEAIPFAISADLSPELKGRIVALPETAWQPLRQWKGADLAHRDREWAEVEFTPAHRLDTHTAVPDRHLVIRAHLPQGDLFADGAPVHYSATVTNRRDWDGERLLRWSHERCGTVEPAHDVLKNELGAECCRATASAPTRPGGSW